VDITIWTFGFVPKDVFSIKYIKKMYDFYMIRVSFNLLKASSTTKTGRHDITESEVKTQ
jgi:hypothetical protein